MPLLSLVVLVGLAAVTLGRAWVQRPGLRAVAIMVAVWLGCALLPGPARLTALLLAVPALALLGGALLESGATDRSPRLSIAAATAVTVALVSGMVTVLWPSGPPRPSSYEPLARWLTAELESDVVLSAAPLDRAELVAAGVPAGRFATESVPDGAVTVVPADAGCGEVGTPVARMASAAGSLSVCAPPPSARDVLPGTAIGSTLAAQPGGPDAGPGPAAAAGAPGGRPAGGGAGRGGAGEPGRGGRLPRGARRAGRPRCAAARCWPAWSGRSTSTAGRRPRPSSCT